MFKEFKLKVQESFSNMIKNNDSLFITDIDKDLLWDTYLNSYDISIRQEYNCSCCRHFLKNYGNIVIIRNNKLHTIWNFIEESKEFSNVVNKLNTLVLNSKIKDVFLSDIKGLGTDKSTQKIDGGSILWHHFYLELPKERISNTRVSIDTQLGYFRDNKNVFKRSLDELTQDSTETVLELISQNSLYRGEEFKPLLTEFLRYQIEYQKEEDKDLYCWEKCASSQAILRIRNTAIGTLLIDLSEGKELDKAVTSYEKVVAPSNYKRPTSLVTKSMIEDAEKVINELGYTESLERRFAITEDISINNILFVNRDTKKALFTKFALGVLEEMKEDVIVNPKTLSKVEEITVAKFIEEIIPISSSIEVLFDNTHLNNLVSLITAKNKEAPIMFKWNNPFSWSYTNAVTDSIKEQVKAAGGKVEGELRISLSWFNYDDLDLHVIEPDGNKIYYSNRTSYTGGMLDIDMNAGSGKTRTPVENIIWPYNSKIEEGEYKVIVNNFSRRELKDVGFIVEIECKNEVFNFSYDKSISNGANIEIAKFTYSKKDGIKFSSEVKSNTLSKEKWGIHTNKFHKVSMIMNSPNYWEEAIGNNHLFFILEGAKNDESARGFFNEFLKEELSKNRKVFEVLASKLKIESSNTQLSGLGFSSTQRNSVICRVEGKFKRLLKVNF